MLGRNIETNLPFAGVEPALQAEVRTISAADIRRILDTPDARMHARVLVAKDRAGVRAAGLKDAADHL